MSDNPTREEYTVEWDVTVILKNGVQFKTEIVKKSFYRSGADIDILNDGETIYRIEGKNGNTITVHTSEVAGVITELIAETVNTVKNPYYKEVEE